MTPEPVFGDPMRGDDVNMADVRARLLGHRATWLRGFPCDRDAFGRFAEALGAPVPSYAARRGDRGAHPFINQVRCQPEVRDVHDRAGPLPMHSAQAARVPRPRWFAMLMVQPGPPGRTRGGNGRSRWLRWRNLASAWPALKPLTSPVAFETRIARPPMPIVYPLADAQDDSDRGVRLKYDLLEVLPTLQPQLADRFAAFAEAARALVELAEREAAEVGLSRGDLIVVDNDRWAHGRGPTPARVDGVDNDREVWSVCLR